MKILELLLLSYSLSVVLFIKKDREVKLLVPAQFTFVFLFILHLFLDGVRLQLFGAYLFPVYFYLIYNSKNRVVSFILRFFSILIIIISLTLIFLFPYPKLTNIDGEYLVGTESFDIVDDNRVELYGENVGNSRKIRAQIWFPADENNIGEKDKWLSDGLNTAQGVPLLMGAPKFLYNYTVRVLSNSYLNSKVSKNKKQYPLVILSHGWTSFRHMHTDLGEFLASNGYIVVGIEHTYGSIVTTFGDGTSSWVDPAALPLREETPDFLDYANRLVKTFSGDDKITLEYIVDKYGDYIDVNAIKHILLKGNLFV